MEVRLDKPLNEWGRFWLPGDTGQGVSGRLIYNPVEGITIEITAGLVPAKFDGSAEKNPIVHGQLMSGSLVTLVEAFVTSQSAGFGGDGPVTITADKAIIGCHVPNPEQMRVKSCSLGVADLDEWLRIKCVSSKDARDSGEWIGVDLHYRKPSEIRIEIPDAGFTLSINWEGKLTLSRNNEVKLHPQAYLTVTAKDSLSLADSIVVAWELQSLLALLIGHVPPVRWMTVEPLFSVGDSKSEKECQILYHQRAESTTETMFASNMLLPYQIVQPDFAAIVNNWFARAEQAKLAAMIYVESMLAKPPTVNVGFLAVVHAIEAYHRSTHRGLYMDQGAFDAAIKKMTDQIPTGLSDDHRHSLKSRLRYGNEYSMRKRVADLLGQVPEPLLSRIAGPSVPQFVQRVVATRNYFTHWDSQSKGEAFDNGKDILNATKRLRALFIASIFHDLGVTEQILMDSIANNSEFTFWFRQPLN